MEYLKVAAAVAVIIGGLLCLAYILDSAANEYKDALAKCEAAGGVYLHREGKCVELKVIPLK